MTPQGTVLGLGPIARDQLLRVQSLKTMRQVPGMTIVPNYIWLAPSQRPRLREQVFSRLPADDR
jgi:hypothetical protein